MIVVMAAGLAGNLTFNPFEAVTTFTVQIKTILAQVISGQAVIADGLAEMCSYRKASDQVAILANRSLEFLARSLFGVES